MRDLTTDEICRLEEQKGLLNGIIQSMCVTNKKRDWKKLIHAYYTTVFAIVDIVRERF